MLTSIKRKVRVAALISNRADFNARKLPRTERNYVIIRASIL